MPRPRSSGRAHEPAVTIRTRSPRASLSAVERQRRRSPSSCASGRAGRRGRPWPGRRGRAASAPRRGTPSGRPRARTRCPRRGSRAGRCRAAGGVLHSAVEAEPVGLLGQRVVGAGGVEHRLEVLDQVAAAPGALDVGHGIGGDPQRGDRDVGRGDALQPGAGPAVEELERGIGQAGEGGGQRRRAGRLVGCGHDHEAVLHAVLAGQVVGDAERGVDAAVERAVDVGDEPVDGADVEWLGVGRVRGLHPAPQAGVGPAQVGQPQRLGLVGALAEHREVAPEHAADGDSGRGLVLGLQRRHRLCSDRFGEK